MKRIKYLSYLVNFVSSMKYQVSYLIRWSSILKREGIGLFEEIESYIWTTKKLETRNTSSEKSVMGKIQS